VLSIAALGAAPIATGIARVVTAKWKKRTAEQAGREAIRRQRKAKAKRK
jgi:hypothetical protein